jgi:hypothetical protein
MCNYPGSPTRRCWPLRRSLSCPSTDTHPPIPCLPRLHSKTDGEPRRLHPTPPWGSKNAVFALRLRGGRYPARPTKAGADDPPDAGPPEALSRSAAKRVLHGRVDDSRRLDTRHERSCAAFRPIVLADGRTDVENSTLQPGSRQGAPFGAGRRAAAIGVRAEAPVGANSYRAF